MARTLPIAAEHREFTVKVGGTELSREHQLLSLSIVAQANRLSSARLVYLDGAASSSDFPLSNDSLLVPGAEIEVLAGAAGDQESLFKGLVIRHSLRVRDSSAPQLIIECRHKAVKLTVGRKSAYFFDQTDSDVITALLDAASIDAEVESTSVTHKHLVQFSATDWDFLLLRAAANGLVVLTEDDKVRVRPPEAEGDPVCDLHFGATLLELDATIDARGQLAAVKSSTWDPAAQEVVEKDGVDPGITAPGDLTPGDLAAVLGLEALPLRHPALVADEAQAWADATWKRSQMSRVSGRAKCEGIAAVRPGKAVNLAGLGTRVNGAAYVSGVRHEFDMVGGWKTHIQFGSLDAGLFDESGASAPRAGALVPSVPGLQVGVVVSNEDPDGEHRVRVRMPLVNADEDGTWARVAALDAGEDRGTFFRPEVGDEVVLGFFDGDPRAAVLLGMLHSSKKPAPLEGSDDNHEKVIKTRSGSRVYFNDDTKVILIETPAGNRLTLSEEDKGVLIEDENGNKLEMSPDGITLESAKAITIKAGTELTMEGGTSAGLKAGTSLSLEGSAGANLESSGNTVVKGSLVQIN